MQIKTLVYISIFLMVISMSLNYYINYYIVKANNANDNKTNQFVKDSKQNLESIEQKIRNYINPKEEKISIEEKIPIEEKKVIEKDKIIPETIISKINPEINKSNELDIELKKVNEELL